MMTYHSKGKDWEALLSSAFSLIDNCTIRKQDPPVAYIRRLRGASFEARYRAKGGLDFEGGIGPKFIAIEAKDIFEKRFNFKSKLRDHQLRRMREVYESGAIAILFVRFKQSSGDYAIALEYPDLKDLMDEGLKSLSIEEVENTVGIAYGDVTTAKDIANLLREALDYANVKG